MRFMKRVQGIIAIAVYVMLAVLVLGGCPYSPPGADKADAGDRGTVPERPECTDKVSACRNKCYQADLGPACRDCCVENGDRCDRNESYSFYACLDV